MTQVAEIWDVLEPYLAAEQLELDDLELTGQGSGRILRVTVDGEDVTIDRLAELSRGLSRLVDNTTNLNGDYQLEVSSPGLERKLKRPAHFAKSVGREVVAKVATPESNTTWRGTIITADDDSFTIEADDGAHVVGYADVITAKTVFRWEKAPKPGH